MRGRPSERAARRRWGRAEASDLATEGGGGEGRSRVAGRAGARSGRRASPARRTRGAGLPWGGAPPPGERELATPRGEAGHGRGAAEWRCREKLAAMFLAPFPEPEGSRNEEQHL